MVFVLNVLLGLLAGFLSFNIMLAARVDRQVAVVIATVIGIIVFIGNFGAQIV